MRIGFERGVPSAASQLVGGGLLVTAAPHSLAWWVGSGLLAVGVIVLIEGVRIDGVPWWRWMRGERRGPTTYMTLYDAVHYLADESDWGWRKRQLRTSGLVQGCPVTMEYNATLEAPIELAEQASREGSLVRIWGTLASTTQTTLIDHSFWLANGFHLDGCVRAGAEGRSEPRIHNQGARVYERLCFDRAGVLKTWPRMNVVKGFILKRRM